MDYYATLGVSKDAGIKEVTGAFRNLAIEAHTLRVLDNTLAERQKVFSKICEAYEVLSTPELRSVYDSKGYDALRNGIPGEDDEVGATIGGYVFSGNTHAIFKNVFGSNSPFIDNFEYHSKMQLAKNEAAFKAHTQPEDIEVVLACSIFEFYNGSLK